MCGICGFSRAATRSSLPDTRRFLIAGLLAIEDRGYDSTGVAWTQGKQSQVWYDKRVGRATKVAGKLDLSGRSPILSALGHTRWSSKGAHTYDNAHPVIASNIVLVHNGVIDNDDELVELAATPRVGEVDTWALAGLIQNHAAIGAEHPADVLALVEGDAAIGWYDANEPRDLHLARLIGRPMTLGWTRRGDLVMSSTRRSLQHTARITGVSISGVIDVPRNTYLRVRLGKIVEWRGIGTATTTAKPKHPVQRPLPLPAVVPDDALIHDVVRTEVPRRQWRSQGITDLVENRPEDWWDEAERLLGDDWADANWPSGTEQIRRRPRNGYGW